MTGCVFVGKLEHGDCLPVNQNLPKKIFDYALEMARAIQQGREIENKLLTDVFDSEEK